MRVKEERFTMVLSFKRGGKNEEERTSWRKIVKTAFCIFNALGSNCCQMMANFRRTSLMIFFFSRQNEVQ